MISQIQKIESSTNGKFKFWQSLTTGKGLKNADEFLLSGEKIIREFLEKPHLWSVRSILTSPNLTDKLQSLNFSKIESRPLVFELSSELFKEIDSIGTHFPILVLQKKELPLWNPQSTAQGFEVLLPLGDPQNIGASIRTAIAMNIDKIVLLKEAANPFLPQAIKASAGSILFAPVFKGPSIHEISDYDGYFGLDLNGKSLNRWSAPKSFRLLVGEEGLGLPKTFNGERIHIPMNPLVESLNAQTSLALVAYEVFRQK